MKNFFFLLAIALTVASCSQDDNLSAEQAPPTTPDTMAYASKTFAALEEYNNELLTKRPRTRGWLSDLFFVVGADIVGMAEGLEAGAVLGTALGAATGGTGLVVVEAVCGTICGSAASSAAAKGIGCSIVASPTQLNQFGVLSTDIYVANIRTGDDFKNKWNKFPFNSAFNKINLPQKFEHLRRIGEDHNGCIKQ